LLVSWRQSGPAAQRMAGGFKNALKEALVAQLLGVAQLDEIRAKLESALREIQPFRRKLEYKWTLTLGTFPRGGFVQFVPKGGLTLTARTLINPPKPDGSIDLPRSDFEGQLGAFAIEVPGYIGLDFKPFKFASGSGHSAGLDAKLGGVRIQPKLAFIALLGAYLGFSGRGGSDKPSGPYILPRRGGPGVRAGFALSIGAFTIGTLGFANVFFDAGCELPFDSGEAVVSIGLSSREAPFTLIAAPYGGSGFVRLFGGRVGKTIGITSFDAGFEYGGAAAVSYGILQGVGRVMTGIYISQVKGASPQLGGLFSASFVGHVACFGIAASFLLMVRPTNKGMMGVAQLSFQFSVGMFKVRFRVTVRRNLGPAIGSVVADATPLDGGPVVIPVRAGSSAEVLATATTHAVSPLQNWEVYKGYYRRIAAKGRRGS
jgi:hypothetical protein